MLAREFLKAVEDIQNKKGHKRVSIVYCATKIVARNLISSCVFMDLHFVSVRKNAKKELVQYSAMLTSRLVNNACIPYFLEQAPGRLFLSYFGRKGAHNRGGRLLSFTFNEL